MKHSEIEQITRRNVETIAKLEAASINARTFGDRVADQLVFWVGSWTFLIVQGVLLVLWMIANTIGIWRPWDPYPYILLNLVLSFQGAFATPLILMSQNRQVQLSERRNELDLQVNLLTEQENTEQLRLIRMLCEKAGIRVQHSEERAMEQSLDPDAVIQQIVDTVEASVSKKISRQT